MHAIPLPERDTVCAPDRGALAVVLAFHRCACGRRARLRLEYDVASTRGVAVTRGGPRCPRCADRDAQHLLASGCPRVAAKQLPERSTR